MQYVVDFMQYIIPASLHISWTWMPSMEDQWGMYS